MLMMWMMLMTLIVTADAWIDATHTAIGAAIAQLAFLESVAFELPELIQFDGNILEVMRGCSQLRHFKMQGGPISDATVELLCKWCPFLENVALIYTKHFPAHPIRPTSRGLEHLVNLKHLKYLTLNGTHITDYALGTIICGCEQLIVCDVRDSPEITNDSLNSCFEAALSQPERMLSVYVAGTQIDYDVQEDDVLMPRNLRLLYTPRDDEDDDVEFDGEEFEYNDTGGYFADVSQASGLVFADAYMYTQPDECIRYCLEDLDI